MAVGGSGEFGMCMAIMEGNWIKISTPYKHSVLVPVINMHICLVYTDYTEYTELWYVQGRLGLSMLVLGSCPTLTWFDASWVGAFYPTPIQIGNITSSQLILAHLLGWVQFGPVNVPPDLLICLRSYCFSRSKIGASYPILTVLFSMRIFLAWDLKFCLSLEFCYFPKSMY